MYKIPEYVQVTPGKCPGPAYVPVARLVLRLGWAPLPADPLLQADDDAPRPPQAAG